LNTLFYSDFADYYLEDRKQKIENSYGFLPKLDLRKEEKKEF